MGKGKVTNINNGGVVHVQAGNDPDSKNGKDARKDATEVTNINNGGVVGIQARTVSNSNVVITN